MKAKVSLKMFVLSAALLVVSLATSARSYDNQLIYNPIEENGMTVGQTVYKMDGNTLANYMKYNYKYEDVYKRQPLFTLYREHQRVRKHHSKAFFRGGTFHPSRKESIQIREIYRGKKRPDYMDK